MTATSERQDEHQAQNKTPENKPSVAVVGAGIAGLTAALRLAERGFAVTVFEERVYLGGKLGAHHRRWYPVSEQEDRVRSVANRNASHRDSIEESLAKGRLPEFLAQELNERVQKARKLLHAHEIAESPTQEGALRSDQDRSPDILGNPHITKVDQPQVANSDEWLITTGTGRYVLRKHRDAGAPLRFEISDDVYHEHCYHMFLNWYHNFWRLMEDAGCEKRSNFQPKNRAAHLYPGDEPLHKRMRMLEQIGSLDHAAGNLLSGVIPVPDLFLWLYSMKDLMGQPLNSSEFLDQVSVNGFMGSRWYATEQSARFHEDALTKAFAVPSYLISATAYRDFARYSIKTPSPMLWVLKRNSDQGIFAPLERALVASGGMLHRGRRVTGVTREDARLTKITWVHADIYGDPEVVEGRSRAVNGADGQRSKGQEESFDYVVLAVPPKALCEILEGCEADIAGLPGVRKLQSGVTAALDLYFNKRIADHLPDCHVILRGSMFGLSFIDNAQIWLDDPNMKVPERSGGKTARSAHERITCLNVAATDFPLLEGMSKDEATKAIITELKKYLDFEDTDIDYTKTYLQRNDREPLFVNEVGSEQWRPKTKTEIPNLFLAGDYCDNPINIVTVEGAVVSGLLAARAVQARLRADLRSQQPRSKELWLEGAKDYFRPIEIIEPESYPEINAKALKLAMTPYALAAKAWSRTEQLGRSPSKALSPRELHAMGTELFTAPASFAVDLWSFGIESMRWMADLHLKKKRQRQD